MNSALGYPSIASSSIMFFLLSSCKGFSIACVHLRWWLGAVIAWGDGKSDSAAWIIAFFS